MKKKLVVLLAVVMAFAFSASAYAATTFSDISEQPVNVQDSIAKTVALGIIEGYEDGTFGPDQNITRAEFAKIAVTAAGAKDTATMLEKNNSTFKDVKANEWYTGWINASESLGIFQGDGNGNFRPNDTITNQEVITVLMRLLGYNDNLTGTWPVNYVTQANKDGILDNVAIVASAAAKRADVVVMLDDTLDTDIVTYDKDTNEFVKKQTTKSGSSYITLMEDSFKGNFYEVDSFQAVEQVRDFAKKTLNWDIAYTYTDNDGKEATGNSTMIIDGDTRVSYNGGSLFDLEGHQGKVYFVTEDNRQYVRFIEVESYTKTVTDQPEADGSKVTVGKTNYNAVTENNKNAVDFSKNAEDGKKNSNYVMYFNDDDQVYAVKSDLDFTEKAFYVKSVNTTTMRLVGDKNSTVSLSNDILVYTEDGFVTPEDLKAGDAVLKIQDDLYVKVADATATLTKSTTDKVTIGGKNYVKGTYKTLDGDYEEDSTDLEDIYNNSVRFLLNKDNSVAAIIIDETSTGTTLYGIVLGGDGGTGWGNAGTIGNVSIFTEEGKTVSYDLTSDGKDDLDRSMLGYLVSYKLDKDGKIKEVNKATENLLTVADGSEEIEVKNNAYLVGSETVTLASNVVIFEVDEDDGDVDPSIVNRSTLLSGGDFTPSKLENIKSAYAYYFTNSNGAIKVLAYTTAGTSTYKYGVADADPFSDKDHSNDDAITISGDDNVYDLNTTSANPVKNHYLIIYTQSGDKMTVKKTYAHKTGVADKALEVKGYTDGLITFDTAMKVYEFSSTEKDPIGNDKTASVKSVMTNSDTIVYVMNSSTGYYEAGTLEDISKNAYVYVPVVDKDGYADVVIVDEYTDYDEVPAPTEYNVTVTDDNETGATVTPAKGVKGTTVTLTVPAAAFQLAEGETEGSTVTVKVNDSEITAPEVGDYTATFTIGEENLNIVVTRTVSE